MINSKSKKNQSPKGNRFLINVTVLGSPGPIRFVVNEDELVSAVIDKALKSYVREGRLPILGPDLGNFMLYCPNAGTEGLSPFETIGSSGSRNFLLYKKAAMEKVIDIDESSPSSRKAGSGSWKSWFHRSRSHKISSF